MVSQATSSKFNNNFYFPFTPNAIYAFTSISSTVHASFYFGATSVILSLLMLHTVSLHYKTNNRGFGLTCRHSDQFRFAE